MNTMHSAVTMQYAQERIARAQAERLAKEARQMGARKRSHCRAFRLFRRPVVTNAVAPRR